jgi:DNA-binding GntR family transcriptional regulator
MAKPPVKAQQLAGELAERIRSGEYATGSYLPAERQLAETYSTSRGTVRQALAQLAADELIEWPEGSAARVLPAIAGRTERAADVAEQLEAIRAELREVNSRLSAIESRGDAANSTG